MTKNKTTKIWELDMDSLCFTDNPYYYDFNTYYVEAENEQEAADIFDDYNDLCYTGECYIDDIWEYTGDTKNMRILTRKIITDLEEGKND